jgi:hypothetical protein
MNRNLSKNTVKRRNRKPKTKRKMELSPTKESDTTKKHNLKKLVTKLQKTSKIISKIYEENKEELDTNSTKNKHFGNKVGRAVQDLRDVIEYLKDFDKAEKFLEYSSREEY